MVYQNFSENHVRVTSKRSSFQMQNDCTDKIAITELTENKTIQILRELIAIPTVDPPGNEMEAAEYVRSILEPEGIACRIYDLGNGRANLVARLNGTGGNPSLVYSAHLDTIAVDEAQWTMPPFGGDIKDGRLYGRGATDMKSGMVSMICAAIQLKRENLRLGGDLVLAFSAAENSTGMGALQLIDSGELEGAGAMLISEPTSLSIFIAEKGALWLRAIAKGGAGHGAFVEDWRKDYGNAIIRMASFIDGLKYFEFGVPPHRHLGTPSINVGKIEGGVSAPTIPGSCTVEIDIRMLPGMNPDAVQEMVQASAGGHIDIQLVDFKPPVVTAEEDPFVKLCAASCEAVCSKKPDVTGVSYYSDAAFFKPAMDIPIVIIGPGEVGHSGIADEYVEVANLMKTNRIFFQIAQRYLSGSTG
jgi:succinyl-diaminopimelate desuccinylase